MLFRRNNINIGIGLGILVPMIVFGLLYSLFNLLGLTTIKTRTLALISVCLNMVLVNNFRKFRAGESMRGTVLATVAMAFGWFAWFYNDITAEW